MERGPTQPDFAGLGTHFGRTWAALGPKGSRQLADDGPVGSAAQALVAASSRVVPVAEHLRLRDLPALFAELELSVRDGAGSIDLHVGRTRHMTRAAYSVLEGAIRRFAERGIVVQLVGGVFAIR